MDEKDLAAMKQLITDAVKPVADALAETARNQKVLADTLAADKQKADDAIKAAAAEAAKAAKEKPEAGNQKPGEAAKPLTQEDVTKILNEGIATALKAKDAETQSSAARGAFIAEKLKGVPAAYAAALGSDPAKWAAEETAVRDRFKKDMEALGLKVPAIGGTPPGTGTSASLGGTPQPKPIVGADVSAGAAKFAEGMVLPGR